MGRDWLLIETLGPKPVVVSQGSQLKKMVPLGIFLRRNSILPSISAAIAETVRQGKSIALKSTAEQRCLYTRPVAMSDGRIHGVQLWAGNRADVPPPPPRIGAVVWNLTTGVASDTPEALVNVGIDPETEPLEGRCFADDLSISNLHHEEGSALALTMNAEPGDTLCNTWDVTARDGQPIRVAFTSRALVQTSGTGDKELVLRAMNWRVPRSADDGQLAGNLADGIIKAMVRPGEHRFLIGLETWTLLKWIDEPYPHVDWRGECSDKTLFHPDDTTLLSSMRRQFVQGPASGVLRFRGASGGWTFVHVTICHLQLSSDAHAGLVSVRSPTESELPVSSPDV